MDEAAFLGLLDGLALPHRLPLGEVRLPHCLRKSRYYGWDVIEIDAAKPILPGQVGPFWFNAGPDPDLLPPKSFTTFISIGGDARLSHGFALQKLTTLFGPPAQQGEASNTISQTWRFGHAALQITTWPAELNRDLRNPAVESRPELATFCHLRLTNGLRPELTAHETQWIESLAPLSDDVTAGAIVRPFDPLWNGAGAGALRWLPPRLLARQKRIGLSQDQAAILGVEADEAFIIAREQIRGVTLIRRQPARGSGGAEISLDHTDAFSTGARTRQRTILQSSQLQGLDATARKLAQWAAAPLKIDEAWDD